jgi:hypothetical protein
MKSDFEAIFSILVASTIPKWLKFKFHRWMQKLHQSTWEHAILYAKTSSEDYQNLIALFLRKTNIRT